MDPGDPSIRQVLPAADASWSTYFNEYGLFAALLLLLLVLASLASATEAAFFTLTPEHRNSCRESTDPADKRIARLLERPRRLLASLVILNNTFNIAIVVIVTYLTWHTAQHLKASAWWLIGGTLLTTLAIVLFGEIIPKLYASQNNITVARQTAPLAQLALFLFKPFSILLVNLSNQIDKRIQRRGYRVSVEELNQAVDLAGSDSTAEEREIIKGIVNFSNLTARQVMRSRVDISAVDFNFTFTELMERINVSGYSRIPVFKESIDQVEGILYIKDLLPHLNADHDFSWQHLIRPAFFIPEQKKVDDLLQDFQKKRVHLAIVVDEYGGTRGLVTLEDIIEEILGDINDEFDDEELAPFRRINDHTFIFEGKTALSDVCRALDIDLSLFDDIREGSESLGGLLLALFNHLPGEGEEISTQGLTFHVLKADHKRIHEVRITRKAEQERPESVASKES
ncbi:gliding motility-associated protein GldE [Arsenicibacter rosenii]|uniref:Magnesium/cobalt efflux protein n=1 Tax=Arsenicibacter rosenii TaxID=1750698 RepID=A0A1S2VKS9_9BACT|nr:gliding motility-associated protein GldE [Arsenicibacter rosenii]OIN58825.1 magnesium/cobalt efflux protein [Arsenicibacter rosenii]